MKKNIAILLLFLLLFVIGFYPKPLHRAALPSASNQTHPTILVSIAPYIFFVNQITGKTLPVVTLIPEGANPHIYEPKPKEVAKVRNAHLWIRLGDSFDQKVFKVLQEQNPTLNVVDVAKGIPLLSECKETTSTHAHHHCASTDEGKDIHIWLSPKLAKTQAITIATALIELLPENQQLYTDNLNIFLEKLDQLDDQITTLLTPKKGQAVLVSHPAFTYFCHDYGLIQLSVETEGKDPLPQQITQLLKEARAYTITAVILEPQYSNKGAELIAEQLDISPVTIDPYTENYLDNLKKIAEIIAH